MRYKTPNGRKVWRWFNNLIIFSKEYYNSNGIEDLKEAFKHELVHLIARDSHGNHFKQLARACGAERYCKPRR